MQTLLVLHSFIRWLILFLLVYNMVLVFYKASSQKSYTANDAKWNLFLLIFVHTNLLIGLYQYFFGAKGFVYIKDNGFADVMKSSLMRFWAVEHITGMLIAAILITITRSIAKKTVGNVAGQKKLGIIYLIALIIIIAVIPFPFRTNFHYYPWFRWF